MSPLAGLLIVMGFACVCAIAAWQQLALRASERALAAKCSPEGELLALQQAARAKAASEAKSRFLANVSHEVRTPLAGILGMAELLATTRLSGEQGAYVEAIRQSGTALASLIDEVLDFSRIEAGRLELTHEPFDVLVLVESIVELLAPRAQAKGLDLACYVSRDVPNPMTGDAARVRQILLNLIANAIKFTQSGGVGVRVQAGSGSITFEVTDTGSGVATKNQSLIFEEFERADEPSATKNGGTGLGLAISRRLAVAMAGTLELVQSSLDGSVFRFSLPVDRLQAGMTRMLATQSEQQVEKTALIVSNSRFQRQCLQDQLSELGIVAEILPDTAQALARLACTPAPDLVVADCALGRRVLGPLAESCQRAGVGNSILLISPLERQQFTNNLAEGFRGWLVKPVRQASLIARLGGMEMPNTAKTVLPTLKKLAVGKSVLLAEDDDVNALVATRHLEQLGAKVTRATDGTEALALARRAHLGEMPRFDLVLMDLRMPGLDGREVAKAIRQLESQGNSTVPIIALTANSQNADWPACQAAGMNGFLAKPVDSVLLAEWFTEAAAFRHSA